METEARYTLIGSFALGIIALGFAFVYWLNAGGGLGARTTYQLRYDSPVSGLLEGAPVLFNGIRAGEVTALRLDPARPSDVMVEIAVRSDTPVRADTKVGIDFQGLTGAPVVSLAGGTPALPLLATAKGERPVLNAEPNAGQGMTQAARDAIRSIDKVVTENAEPFKSLIANADKFAQALARNSDKIDGLVSGLEKFTGGGNKVPNKIYDLAPATGFPPLARQPAVQLQISEATTLSMLDTDRIVLRGETSAKPVIDNAQWPDLLPKVVQARLVQSFENAGYSGVLGRAPDAVRPEYQMSVEIRAFSVSADPGGTADVELAVRLVSSEGKVAGSKVFKASAPLASLAAPDAARALNAAFSKVATEIVTWTLAGL